MARYGYVYNLPLRWSLAIFLLHGAALAALGYRVWPSITVSPRQVLFQGFPDETFNFSVTNGRADDVYDVQIPLNVGNGRHLDSKLSAKVTPNGDPSEPMREDCSYCYGIKGDVTQVMPSEREVLIVKVKHLAPQETRSFSVTYTGGDGFEAKSGVPNFISTPYSYSPLQGTMDVRGDYRICKFLISPNQSKDR
jgi:hypothetical protein